MANNGEFTVEAEIDERTGDLSVGIKGVKGPSCLSIIEEFDAVGTVELDEHHQEYYEQEQTVQRVSTIKRK